MAPKDKVMPWKDHLDKIGIAGSFIAGACCLGLPAVLSIVTAVGLGFLIKDAILLPLMVVFLAVSLVGLYLGYRVHRRPWALVLASVSSVGAFFFIFVHAIKFAAYLAIAGLVLASILNVISRRKSGPTSQESCQ
jgi:mercuric ion transport protein